MPVAPTLTAPAPVISADIYGDPLGNLAGTSLGPGVNGLGDGKGALGSGHGDGYGSGAGGG